MTHEEAVKTIQIAISEVEWNYPLDYAIAFEMAIKALEKQIAKKPFQTSQLNFYWCPNCECAIKKRVEHSLRIIENCPFCGQALDWSDTE
ncbi:MAG: hypothetical protein ACI4I6_07650 [Hominimerdicola sp.]